MRDAEGCFGCAVVIVVAVVGAGVYFGRIAWERSLTDPDAAVVEAETAAIAIDACSDVTRPLLQRIEDLEARVDDLEHERATIVDLEWRIEELESRRR